MKANELMIGDWVMVNDVEHTHPLQVAEILMKSGTYYATLYWDGMPDNVNPETLTADVDKVLPIPLTPEILEKNGFEKALQVSDTEPFDTDEDGNKHYSYNKTFWGWWQPDNIFSIPANGLGWLNIKYVHQLQHALRLCEIEKEIIL